MEWNTVERAIKTEIDTRTKYKGVGKLGWLMSDINCNIPTTRRWAHGETMQSNGRLRNLPLLRRSRSCEAEVDLSPPRTKGFCKVCIIQILRRGWTKLTHCVNHCHCSTWVLNTILPSPQAHLHVVGMLQFMSDTNQPSLPTPFYSVLVSISVFMTLSTVFQSINSSDNSSFSDSVLPVLSLP